ncbi:hypothetical protein ACOJBM_04140 [Rhizobium beringeri]
MSQVVDDCTKAVVDNDPRAKNAKPKPAAQKNIQECLRALFMEYLDRAVKEKRPEKLRDKSGKRTDRMGSKLRPD